MLRERVPPVPGFPRLAWLLFMQPLRLHQLFQEWEIRSDPSLLRLWPRARAGDPIVRKLLGQWGLLLFVCIPILTFAIAGLLKLLFFPVDWSGTALGVAIGLAFGAALVVMLGVAGGVAFGVVGGVAVGVAGATGAVTESLTLGLALGLALALALGLGLGLALGVASGVALGTAFRVMPGVALGVMVAAAVGIAVGVPFGVMYGVKFGLVTCLTTELLFFRLVTYPLETLLCLVMAWWARLRPERSPSLARWLPFRHHDLIYLPLPGLGSFLLHLAEAQPALAKSLLTEATASLGQKGVARRALIELQARDLEQAARNRLFARATDLDFPFLPFADKVGSAPPPILLFQTAARDLSVGVSDPHQRSLALSRARRTLEGFIASTQTASSTSSAELSHRLLSTARLWLDVVQDEERRLAAEETQHPHVPRAFVAGAPLAPDDPQSQPLFKGRTDLARLVEHDLGPDRRGVLVIVGQRRMGKSSFRNWLPRLLGTGTDVLVANFQELSGHPHRATPHRWILDLLAAHLPGTPAPPTSPHWTEALDWLRARDAQCASRGVLVVIDEVERVQDGIREGWCSTDFLDFLRAAGDSLRSIRFLLLTAFPLHRLGPQWVDRLISATTRGISYLDPASAEELVRAPIPHFPDIYPEGGVDRILQETHCHPFLIQKVCDELCKHLNENGGRRRATDEELTEVFDRVADEKLFDELWNQRTPEEQRALHHLAHAPQPLEAGPAMRQLTREGYVELRGEQATLAVPLFGTWIRFTQGRTPP